MDSTNLGRSSGSVNVISSVLSHRTLISIKGRRVKMKELVSNLQRMLEQGKSIGTENGRLGVDAKLLLSLHYDHGR